MEPEVVTEKRGSSQAGKYCQYAKCDNCDRLPMSQKQEATSQRRVDVS